MKHWSSARLLLLAAGLVVPGVAAAARADGAPSAGPPNTAGALAVIAGEVFDLRADKLDVDISAGSAVLEGNVSASLGDLSVSCQKIEVKYDQAPNVRWARGSGAVTARMRGIEATAARVEVDIARRNVELSGNVRLSRGRGWVTAERARIDLSTRHVTLDTVTGSIPVQPPAR